MTQERVAYFAGFFDGEGCVDIRRRSTHKGKYHRFEVRVQIYQGVDWPLVEIQKDYGGSIDKYSRVHRLTLTGEGMKRFLRDISPYLIVKAEETQLALSFLELSEIFKTGAKPGHRGFSRADPCADTQRVIYMHEIRAKREAKGVPVTRRREYRDGSAA